MAAATSHRMPPGKVIGYEKVATSGTGAIALDAAKYAPTAEAPRAAERAFLQVIAQPARIGFDGIITPDSDDGLQVPAGDTLVLEGLEQIREFRAVREGGTDTTIVAFYLR